MSKLAHYSPEDVNLVVGGIYQITGYVEGSYISVSKDVPTFTTRESSDGEVSRAHSNSTLYTLTLTLHSASDSNQVLTYLAELDSLTKMAKLPIIIKDSLGQSLFFSPSSWIEQVPDLTFSTNIVERDWIFKCSNSVMNVGGNYSKSSTGQDIFNIAGPVAGRMLF